MYVIMKNAGLSTKELGAKTQLEKDIEEVRSKLSKNESDFTNEKNKLQTEIGKLKDINIKLEADKMSLTEKCKKLEIDYNKSVTESKSLKEEKINLESQIAKLNTELSKYKAYVNNYNYIYLITNIMKTQNITYVNV